MRSNFGFGPCVGAEFEQVLGQIRTCSEANIAALKYELPQAPVQDVGLRTPEDASERGYGSAFLIRKSSCDPEGAGGRSEDGRCLPQARDQHRNVLSLESQVRWSERVGGQALTGAGE